MDNNRAFIEIGKIFGSEEWQGKSFRHQIDKVSEILSEVKTYYYNLGRKNGMSTAVSLLTDLVEKEQETI